MISINKCISPYSIGTFEQSRRGLYKPSNIGQKILNMKQLIDDNEVRIEFFICRASKKGSKMPNQL